MPNMYTENWNNFPKHTEYVAAYPQLHSSTAPCMLHSLSLTPEILPFTLLIFLYTTFLNNPFVYRTYLDLFVVPGNLGFTTIYIGKGSLDRHFK